MWVSSEGNRVVTRVSALNHEDTKDPPPFLSAAWSLCAFVARPITNNTLLPITKSSVQTMLI